MKTPVDDASARQQSGAPSSGLGANDGRKDRLRGLALAELDGEIAGLAGQSTQELRRVWRTFYHTGPPLGLSRDLIIRGLADQLQQRAHSGPSRALQRRLRMLAGEFEKGARSFDPEAKSPRRARSFGSPGVRADRFGSRALPCGARLRPYPEPAENAQT